MSLIQKQTDLAIEVLAQNKELFEDVYLRRKEECGKGSLLVDLSSMKVEKNIIKFTIDFIPEYLLTELADPEHLEEKKEYEEIERNSIPVIVHKELDSPRKMLLKQLRRESLERSANAGEFIPYVDFITGEPTYSVNFTTGEVEVYFDSLPKSKPKGFGTDRNSKKKKK